MTCCTRCDGRPARAQVTSAASRVHRRGPRGHAAMNIVVCVKYVPDATGDRQFEADNTVDRVGVDGLLSELDEYAVEQALQIKEKAGDDSRGDRR